MPILRKPTPIIITMCRNEMPCAHNCYWPYLQYQNKFDLFEKCKHATIFELIPGRMS